MIHIAIIIVLFSINVADCQESTLFFQLNNDYEFIQINIESSEQKNLFPFAIGKYEISYALWYKILTWAKQTKGYIFLNSGKEGRQADDGVAPINFNINGNTKSLPVTNISWIDAVVWCNAYSEYLNLMPLYYSNGLVAKNAQIDKDISLIHGEGIRLPNVSEWEYAANKESELFEYAGSNDINEVAWYYQNACDLFKWDENYGIHNSGEKKPNGYGIYDLCGNVAELCNDSVSSTGNEKVICGGSWLNYAKDCKVTSKSSYPMEMTYIGVGMRLVYNK